MEIYIGCDLGGTNIKAGTVNLSTGTVLDSRIIPTLAQEGQDAVMDRLLNLIRSLMADSPGEISGVGVSAPGLVDIESGNILFLTNFPGQWKNFPLAAELKSALGLPISILNDVRAITFGEYIHGAGRGVQRMVCLAIGTGLGGGLVLDGKLVLGFQGSAGEFGHQIVEINGLRCGCGNYGCLEVYTSGPAIASRAEKAVRQGLTTRIADLVKYDLNLITPKIVAQAAEEGDEIALEIWDSVGMYLGLGIANLCVAFGPERVVLSGGVAAAGDLLIKPIQKTLRERVFVMPVEQVEIIPGTLGNDAGILGMASWAASRKSQP